MNDTSPDALRAQTEILRRMTPQARLAAATQLSATARRLVFEGVRRRHPDYDEAQVRYAALRLWLGDDDFRRAYPEAPELAP